MSAARTYLIIAVFGGMVTLMGLFMAWHELGSLSFAAFEAARGRADMAVPAALISTSTPGMWYFPSANSLPPTSMVKPGAVKLSYFFASEA